MRHSGSVFQVGILLMILSLLFLASCKRDDREQKAPYNVLISTTNGRYKDGDLSIYPKINLQIKAGYTAQWGVRVSPEPGSGADEMITVVSESNYVNEIVLDKKGFLRIGPNSAIVTIFPLDAPDNVLIRSVDYIVYEEVGDAEGDCRLIIGDSEYAEGEAVLIEKGECPFVFLVACRKNVKCIPCVKEGALNVGITQNCNIGDGWRAFNGRIYAHEVSTGELSFRIVGDDMAISFDFPVQVVENSQKPVEPLKIVFEEHSSVIVKPDVFSMNCRVTGDVSENYVFEVILDQRAFEYTPIGNSMIEISVPTDKMELGKHVVSVRVLSDKDGAELASDFCEFVLCGFETTLYERISEETNSNFNMRLGENLTYVLCVNLGVEVMLDAEILNTRTGKTIDGYLSGDKKRALFYLRDQDIVPGPQDLEINLVSGSYVIGRTVVVTGWNVYTCTYTISGSSVYEQFSGPGHSFDFPMHFTVSIYLQGVIPYTEAVEIAGRHYNSEGFEYVDIDAMGISFDIGSKETFSTREIYSSNYFKYISDYLSKELKKINAAHASTRWVEENGTWKIESYWPAPYLQAKFIYADQRNDGNSYPEYFEISYNDKQIKDYFGAYGVKVKSYIVEQ